MANQGQVPEWLKHLWKELTTPPHFIPAPQKQSHPEKKETSHQNEKSATDEKDDHPSWWSSWSVSPLPPQKKRKKKAYKKGKSTKKQLTNSPNLSPFSHMQNPIQHSFSSLSESLWGSLSQTKKELAQVLLRHGYHPPVLEHYPFTVYKAEPYGSVIRLQTSAGPFALKRTPLPPERIEFMHEAVCHLHKQNFFRVAPFFPNKKKAPYTIAGGNVYYISEWVHGQECDFSSMIHLAEAAQTLSQFHQASLGFAPKVTIPPAAFSVLDIFRHRSQDLHAFKKKIRLKNKPNAIDQFVLQHIDDYLKQAQRAILLASDPTIKDYLSHVAQSPGLCHLDVTPQNLIYTTNHHVHLIDLDLMTFGPRVLDLAHLMRRSLQKTGWAREVPLVCLVQANSVGKIRREEYILLLALLTFPHRFWHICYAHYVLRHDAQTLGKLQQLQSLEEKRKSFLEDFARQVYRYRG